MKNLCAIMLLSLALPLCAMEQRRNTPMDYRAAALRGAGALDPACDCQEERLPRVEEQEPSPVGRAAPSPTTERNRRRRKHKVANKQPRCGSDSVPGLPVDQRRWFRRWGNIFVPAGCLAVLAHLTHSHVRTSRKLGKPTVFERAWWRRLMGREMQKEATS